MRIRFFLGILLSLCFAAAVDCGDFADLSRDLKFTAHSKSLNLLDQGSRRPGQRLVDSALGVLRTIHDLCGLPEWKNRFSPRVQSFEAHDSAPTAGFRPLYLFLNILLN